jgi:hypothetical protein
MLWWEMRRLPYNLVVGAVGLAVGIGCFALVLFSEMKLGEPFPWPDPPLFALVGAVFYGIAANVWHWWMDYRNFRGKDFE